MGIPLVSVICLCYNHAPYLRQSLESILCQETDFDFEVIIHDDASMDNSATIISEYEYMYPKQVFSILQKENLSKSKRCFRDFVYPKLRGEFTAICEGDDYWCCQKKIQRQISYMRNHPECSMTASAAYVSVDETIIYNDKRSDVEKDFTADEVIGGGGDFLTTATLCCRTEYVLELPAFRSKAIVGDYPLAILMALKGIVHYFPEVMAVYRYMRPGSWTAMHSKEADKQKLKTWYEAEIAMYSRILAYTGGKYKNTIRQRQLMFEDKLWKLDLYSINEYLERISYLENPDG